MWSDSIFLSRDRAKLLYLCRAMQALYTYGPYGVHLWVNSTVQEIAPGILPPAVSWVEGGERIVMIAGSTTVEEFNEQMQGWLVAWPIPAGWLNRNHYLAAVATYNGAPNDAKLYFGHSKGAAVAGIMGMLSREAGLTVRVLGVGAPRFADLNSSIADIWSESIYLSDPRDVVSEVPAIGTGLNDWRIPFFEWNLTPDGIVRVESEISTTTGLAALAITYGDRYHAIGQYIRALSDPPVFTAPNKELGMSTHRLTVHGSFHEQSVINQFWYGPSVGGEAGGQNPQDLAQVFSQKWRALILPWISDAYSVINYDVQKLHSVEYKPGGTVDGVTTLPSNNYRWAEQYILTGQSGDQGKISASAAFPSFVAIGFRKTAGNWRDEDGVTVPGLKSPRGGGRISGPAENITAALGGNRMDHGVVSNWNGFLNQFVTMTSVASNAFSWHMQILATHYAGVPITVGTPPVGAVRVADVRSISVNPYLTSQNSRKQSLNRLG